MMYYVYILQSKKDGKWYTGSTNDLRKRFNEHNAGKVFSTKGRGPFIIIYYESCLNEYDAKNRERYLKSGMGKRYLKNRLKRFLSLTGFTLMELMIVIVILGVLVSLAIPNYLKTVERHRMTEGYIQLGTIKNAELVYYNKHLSYAYNLDYLNTIIDIPSDHKIGYFDYSVLRSSGGFIIQAERNSLDNRGNPARFDYYIQMNENGVITTNFY